MGIDRQNIPEEYKCELCQPRTIDQNRARTLQLMKNKKEENFDGSKVSQSSPTDLNSLQIGGDRSQLNTFSTIVANKKKGTLSSKSRKSEKSGSGLKKGRETKKSLLQSKRKSSSTSLPGTPSVAKAATSSDADKQLTNLRQWIENYEIAMTNHYSPELRARLYSISKQSLNSSTHNASIQKNISMLDRNCTTVPHAGGKILISTNEISPNNPVIEIRGKYMLTAQFRAQHPPGSPTATTPTPTALASSANGTKSLVKLNAGPFLFFYSLPNDGPEICVDTRTYGNDARFVRRSCRPNAKIVHTIEKGIPHFYIVSLNTIRASTEITIKHEAHDLEALARTEISAPTSTACGCGLIKDCIFGTNNNLIGSPSLPKKNNRPNGHVKNKSSSSSSLPSPQPRKKLKQDKSGRSPSESGDSTIGLQSPIKRSKSQDDTTNESCSDAADVQIEQSTSDRDVIEHRMRSAEQRSANQSATSTPTKTNNESEKNETSSRKSVSAHVSLKSPSKSGSSQKKAVRKSLCSFSEDTGDEMTRKDKEPKKQVEQRKLSREERKMEAYMRAFEKMERTEQRKNEANKHKTTVTVHSTVSSLPSKKRLISSSIKDKSDKSAVRKSSSQQNKRKRKRASKSYSQPGSQKRRRNRSDSHNSDITSDENVTPLMSPIHSTNVRSLQLNEKRDNLAAGLLLSLSSFGVSKEADNKNCVPSLTPYSTNKSPSSTPQAFPVSPACLLIEAAVAPLDNDFKLPAKAKTKKALMNEWLNQSDCSTKYSPSHFSATSSSIDYNATTSSAGHFSLSGHKIEDLADITAAVTDQCADDDELSKGGDAMLVPQRLPTPPLQTSSSVKKRWLRQAISEKCSDDIKNSVTSSPPNGFISPQSAPLKKRRVFNLDATDDVPSPIEDFKDAQQDEDSKTAMSSAECKTEPNEENVCEKAEALDENSVEEEKHKIDVDVDVGAVEEPPADQVKVEAIDVAIEADVQKFEPIESDEEDMDMFQDEPEIKSQPLEYEMISPKSEPEKMGESSAESPKTEPTDVGIEGDPVEDPDSLDLVAKESAAPPMPLPDEEIENIQQKLHSFHSENLMILQTRNRKRISRATTPTSLEDSSNASSSCNTPSYSSQKDVAEHSMLSQKSSSDNVDSLTLAPDQSSSMSSPNIAVGATIATAATAVSTPTAIGQTALSQHVYPPTYGYNTHARNDPYTMPPSQFVNPLASHPEQRYHMHLNGNLATSQPPPPSPQAMIYSQYADNTGPGMRPNWMHTNIPPPPILNSSSYLKSYSTLSDLSPSTSGALSTPTTPSPSTNPLPNPKILTRTQSADPRLNPQKEQPATTPKRKLSINEYRKRKQLTGAGGSLDRPRKDEPAEKIERLEDGEQKFEALDITAVDDVLMAPHEDTTKGTGE